MILQTQILVVGQVVVAEAESLVTEAIQAMVATQALVLVVEI